MTRKEQCEKVEQILTKAWTDVAFKQRLLSDATAVLREEGVSVPDGMEIKVVENEAKVVHLVIPQPRMCESLDEAALEAVVGGATLPSPRKPSSDPLFKIS